VSIIIIPGIPGSPLRVSLSGQNVTEEEMSSSGATSRNSHIPFFNYYNSPEFGSKVERERVVVVL
jgi:hypothetical protein